VLQEMTEERRAFAKQCSTLYVQYVPQWYGCQMLPEFGLLNKRMKRYPKDFYMLHEAVLSFAE
jgi:hypothetical protein